MKYRYTIKELEEAVEKSLSIAQVCKILGIVAKGGNYKTLNDKIRINNIDVTHFTGSAWNQGERYLNFKKVIPLEEVLTLNSSAKSTNHLKKKLIKYNVLENKCSKCGLIDWLDKPIVCELDHINGDNTDNRIENLRILCPNCHSQTNTFRGKNQKARMVKC